MLLLTSWIWQKDSWGFAQKRCKMLKCKIKNYKNLSRILHKTRGKKNKLIYLNLNKVKDLITIKCSLENNKSKFMDYKMKYIL